MPKAKNINSVKDISQKVEKSNSITFVEYRNLSSNALNELRRRVAEVSGEILVAKNTLMRIALGDRKPQETDLQGQTAVLFSFEDSVAPIKAVFEFAKKFQALKIRGAFIDGAYFDANKIAEISNLPTKAELISKILGGFRSPIVGFANVLNGTRSKFVYALSAVVKAREVDK